MADYSFMNFVQGKAVLYCASFLLLLKVALIAFSINFPLNIFFADITKSALHIFVNQARQEQGLKPLAENAKLAEAARLKAENMVQNQYFAHTSPNGISPWHWFLKAGYAYKYAGENLAIGFFESSEVYQAWLNSPSHRANILNPNYTEVGTAVVTGFGANNAIVVVQEFGARAPAAPSPAAKNEPKAQPKAEVKQMEAEKSPSPLEGGQKLVLSYNAKIAPAGESQRSLSFRFANLLLYGYDKVLQALIYGFALILIGALLAGLILDGKMGYKKPLAFRAFFALIILAAAAFVDAEAVLALVPHTIVI